MKKLFVITASAVFLFGCNPASEKKGFELKGKFSNSKNETIYLEEMLPNGSNIVDTTAIDEKGEFTFNTKLADKGFFRIRINDKNFAMLILDSTQQVMIEGDIRDLGNTYKVTGSPETTLFLEFNEYSKKIFQQQDSMQRAFQSYVNTTKMDNAKIDSLSKIMEAPFMKLQDDYTKYLMELIDKNPTSFVCVAAIQKLNPDHNFDYFEKLDKSLLSAYPNSAYVDFFHKSVERLRKTAVGSVAPEFSMDTPDGKTITLSAYRGKFVLLDFWASWCGPCRQESPAMVAIHDKYKEKIEFISVSLDKEKAAWLKGIKDDKLNWTHVSDLAYWDCAAAKLFGVSSIPQTFVIDPNGKIIAKGLRGEELEKKLEEVLK